MSGVGELGEKGPEIMEIEGSRVGEKVCKRGGEQLEEWGKAGVREEIGGEKQQEGRWEEKETQGWNRETDKVNEME